VEILYDKEESKNIVNFVNVKSILNKDIEKVFD